MTQFEQPLIAVDVVPIRYDGARRSLELGLLRRTAQPFEGVEALPGVLLGLERAVEGARRALRDKAGVDADQIRYLQNDVRVFDSPDRDPRQRALSLPHLAVLDPHASSRLIWHAADESFGALPFDHHDIIAAALAEVRTRLWKDADLSAALTGVRFSSADAVHLVTALTGLEPHRANLRRDLERDSNISIAEPGRPNVPVVYRWNRPEKS